MASEKFWFEIFLEAFRHAVSDKKSLYYTLNKYYQSNFEPFECQNSEQKIKTHNFLVANSLQV